MRVCLLQGAAMMPFPYPSCCYEGMIVALPSEQGVDPARCRRKSVFLRVGRATENDTNALLLQCVKMICQYAPLSSIHTCHSKESANMYQHMFPVVWQSSFWTPSTITVFSAKGPSPSCESELSLHERDGLETPLTGDDQGCI